MGLALSLLLLSGGNVLLTLLFQWYVVTRLGVGAETDALFAGLTLPQLILAISRGSLVQVLVPLLAAEDDEVFAENAWFFLLSVTALFALLAAALYLTAGFWVPWLVPGFTPAGQALTVRLTRIQLIGMALTISASILWSAYHARRRFVWVESAQLLAALVSLALLIWLMPRYGIEAAAWLLVLRAALPLAGLWPILGRPRWPPRGHSHIGAEAWRRLSPLLAGSAYYSTDPLVDRFLASLAPAGGLSLLYLGQQLYGAAHLLIDKSVATPLRTLLALRAKAQDWIAFRAIYRHRLLLIGALTSGAFLILLFAGEKLLGLLIGHGGVTAENVRALWWIMLLLLGYFVAGAMGQITSTTFYSMGDTRTPTLMSVITFSLYVPVKVIVFMRYGLAGLAVTTSAYYFLNLALQILLLRRSIPPAEATG